MRQKTQSTEDAKFKTTLENMRYKACTNTDIAFLKTRVARNGSNKPILSSTRFEMSLLSQPGMLIKML